MENLSPPEEFCEVPGENNYIGQVGELSPSPNAMKRKTKGINEHWKPVYLNCAPCNEDYQVKSFDSVLMLSLFCHQILEENVIFDFLGQLSNIVCVQNIHLITWC